MSDITEKAIVNALKQFAKAFDFMLLALAS